MSPSLLVAGARRLPSRRRCCGCGRATVEREAEIQAQPDALDLWHHDAQAHADGIFEPQVTGPLGHVAGIVEEHPAELNRMQIERRRSVLEVTSFPQTCPTSTARSVGEALGIAWQASVSIGGRNLAFVTTVLRNANSTQSFGGIFLGLRGGDLRAAMNTKPQCGSPL